MGKKPAQTLSASHYPSLAEQTASTTPSVFSSSFQQLIHLFCPYSHSAYVLLLMLASSCAFLALLCVYSSRLARAAVVEYDFDIGWVWMSPDDTEDRPVIGINGEWPLPIINVTVGDTVMVNARNSLGNQSTSLHFHGLFMNGSTHMDGTSYVSQCAIAPGSSFMYNFTVQQPGTYWYHSHQKSQYPDGLRGILIVNDPESPYQEKYDEELIVSVSDWYHKQTPDVLRDFDEVANKMRDPTPDAILINERNGPIIKVKPDTTYLIRLINMGAFVGQYFWIQNHAMTVIEVDGVYTEPQETGMLFIATGQRYSVLLKTKPIEDAANYPVVANMDTSSFSKHVPWPVNLDSMGWLVYDDSLTFPEVPEALEGPHDTFALDDMILEPLDKMPLLEPVDRSISLNIDMKTREEDRLHWMFNDVEYKAPELPSLFSAIDGGDNATDPEHFGRSTQTFVLNHGEIIEITMVNKHMWKHPIHLHGHNFQVTYRNKDKIVITPAGQAPLRRDTMVINSHGMLKLRFRADNPGVWLFHCHMEWHAHSGLKATFVEAPLELQEQLQLTQTPIKLNPEQVCKAAQSEAAVVVAGQSAEITSSSVLKSLVFLPKVCSVLMSCCRPVYIAVVVVAVSAFAAVVGLFWYKRRTAKPEEAEYLRVPMLDADEDGKERHENPKARHMVFDVHLPRTCRR